MTDQSVDQRTRSIELEIEVDATPAVVWQAITTAEGLARWFPPTSDGNGAKVGEKLLISWGPEMQWWTTVTEVDPERHVRWIDDPEAYAKFVSGESDKPVMALDWFIETRGGKTVIRLVNSGFDASSDWDDYYNSTTKGWQYFLFNLREYVQRHLGVPRVMILERRPSPVTREELWDRIVGPQGFGLADGHGDMLATGETRSATLGANSYVAHVERVMHPAHLWLRFPALGDALFLAELEPGRDGFSCGLWLSTYGLGGTQLEELRADFSSVSDRIFAAPA